MKFKAGQVFLVSAIALILASAFTACNPVTIDYVFVAGQKPNSQGQGQIQTFLSDRVSGALGIVNSTVASGGVTPVSMATSTDYHHLYVANQGDSTVVEFSISGSGVLASVTTVTLGSEGNSPVAIAMNSQGTLLYVLNQYQPGCSSALTGAESCNGGALAVFPVGSDGSLGSAVTNGGLAYSPVGINPTAVNALTDGCCAYVTTYDPTAGLGYIYGFSATASGALASLPSSPYLAGVKPVSMASTPLSRYVYVTDFSQNELIVYSVLSTGALHPLINGPFKTGNQPSSVTIDPRGIYLYLTNELDNTVSAYAISLATGTPTAAVNTAGTAGTGTGTSPVAILVDPAFARYVYIANYLDNSITGFEINGSTGVITAAQNGPYPSIGEPVALAAVPHGNHSIEVVQP